MDIEGKSSAYASANHNEKLGGYTLLNMRLAYETEAYYQLGEPRVYGITGIVYF